MKDSSLSPKKRGSNWHKIRHNYNFFRNTVNPFPNALMGNR